MSVFRTVPRPITGGPRHGTEGPCPAPLSVAPGLSRAAPDLVVAPIFPAPGWCRVRAAVYIVYYLVTNPRIPSSPPA